jgi:hypothetical protein
VHVEEAAPQSASGLSGLPGTPRFYSRMSSTRSFGPASTDCFIQIDS